MRRLAIFSFLLFGCLALSGCMQLDLEVRLEEDGSATITERLRYARRLLDLEAELPESEGLKSYLAKSGAEARAGRMGQGAKLVSHEIVRTGDGGTESVAVYSVPRLDDVRVIFPYLGYPDHTQRELVLHLYPSYYSAGRTAFSQDQPGWMGIHMGSKVYDPKYAPLPEQTPAERQKLRKLLPVFQDLARDVQVKLDFRAYGPVRCAGWVSWRKGDSRGDPLLKSDFFELLDFHGGQLDAHGAPFIENEELMLDLMRGDFASERVVGLASEFWEKHRTPIYRPKGRWGAIYVLPSRYHYMKYFDGKPGAMLYDGVTANQDRWVRKREE